MAKGKTTGKSNNQGGNASFTDQNASSTGLGNPGRSSGGGSAQQRSSLTGNETFDKLAKAAMSKEMLAAGLAAAAAAISASPSARKKIRDAGLEAADTASNAANSVMNSATRLGSLIAEAVADAAQRMMSGDVFGATQRSESSGRSSSGSSSRTAKSSATRTGSSSPVRGCQAFGRSEQGRNGFCPQALLGSEELDGRQRNGSEDRDAQGFYIAYSFEPLQVGIDPPWFEDGFPLAPPGHER